MVNTNHKTYTFNTHTLTSLHISSPLSHETELNGKFHKHFLEQESIAKQMNPDHANYEDAFADFPQFIDGTITALEKNVAYFGNRGEGRGERRREKDKNHRRKGERKGQGATGERGKGRGLIKMRRRAE